MAYTPASSFADLRALYADGLLPLLDHTDEALFTPVEAVSGWSVGEQLYHLALVNRFAFRNVRLIEQAGADASEGEPTNAMGRLLLRTGRFPRGRSEAPQAARPPADLDRSVLEKQLRRSHERLLDLEPLLPSLAGLTARRPHPVLGGLDPGQWLRFALIHTRHHHGIVQDILASNVERGSLRSP